jgi:integral membrane protein (TIGR01906 family)
MRRFSYFLIGLSVFIFILLFNLNLIGFDEEFYFSKFKENNYHGFDGGVNNEFSKVLSYVNGKEDRIDGDFFNSREKKHLEDVRNLFSISKAVMYISGVVIVLFGVYFYYIKRFKIFLGGVRYGSVSLILVVLLLFLLSLFNFESLFTNFHKLVFSNNLWLLDPAKDNLIKLLPIEIFLELFKKILLYSLLSSLVILLICRFRR